MPECGFQFINRVYRIDPFDFGEDRRRSLLVCAGTGMMMGIMDVCRELRWCIDYDTLTAGERERFTDWMVCAEKTLDVITIAGWFSATNPALLVKTVSTLTKRWPLYVQYRASPPDPFETLRTAHTLEEYISQLSGMLSGSSYPSRAGLDRLAACTAR